MKNDYNYISDINYYLKKFERLGAKYDLKNPHRNGTLFTNLLAGCVWPSDTTFIHPDNNLRHFFADVWGIQFGPMEWPNGLKQNLPGKLIVSGIADGGNYYLVLDDDSYFNLIDHQDGSVKELEDDSLFIDNLLIESDITRSLINMGYPKKPFSENHIQAVEKFKPVNDYDIVACKLALCDFYFSIGETDKTINQFIQLMSEFNYFPNLSTHERNLMGRLLTTDQLIHASGANELKNVLIHQLHNNQELDFWLRDIFLNYILVC